MASLQYVSDSNDSTIPWLMDGESDADLESHHRLSNEAGLSQDTTRGEEQMRVVLDTFPQFQKLAAETRLEIWTLILFNERKLVINAMPPHIASTTGRYNSSLNPVPALLHVNRESRHEALKVYGRYFRDRKRQIRKHPECPGTIDTREFDGIFINPSIDTVEISTSLLWSTKFPGREFKLLNNIWTAIRIPDSPSIESEGFRTSFCEQIVALLRFFPANQDFMVVIDYSGPDVMYEQLKQTLCQVMKMWSISRMKRDMNLHIKDGRSEEIFTFTKNVHISSWQHI